MDGGRRQGRQVVLYCCSLHLVVVGQVQHGTTAGEGEDGVCGVDAGEEMVLVQNQTHIERKKRMRVERTGTQLTKQLTIQLPQLPAFP